MEAHIIIKLFATLRKYIPDFAENYPVEAGTTVHDLIEQLGIPENEMKLIFINGVRGYPESTLRNGDRIGIFPPAGGG